MEKQVYQLADLKKDKFSEYEQVTRALLECEADSAEQYIIRRGEIANEIDEISEQIGRLCDALPNGGLVMDAVLANVSYHQLPPELHPLFEVGQATRSIVYRITQQNPGVEKRLANFRDSALEKVKQNQHMPKIKKYLTDLSGQPEQHTLTDEKA